MMGRHHDSVIRGNMDWSRCEAMGKGERDVFTFPSQLPPPPLPSPHPMDFSVVNSSTVGYPDQLDWHPNDFLMQENAFDALSLMEMAAKDPLFSSLDIIPHSHQNFPQEDLICGTYGSGSAAAAVWTDQMNVGFDQHEQMNQALLLCENYDSGGDQLGNSAVLMNGNHDQERVELERKARSKRLREEKGNSSKMLSREIISQYFYMPITQAAKELNVGLTLLKKRCRELGIRRWPHRKLMSLKTLIKNVQELGKEGGDGAAEGKLREAIEILEHEKKLMEEIPDMQLEDKTKRLRQACFKANYKKRKIMSGSMVEFRSPNSTSSHVINANPIKEIGSSSDADHGDLDDDGDYIDDEEMKSLLSDCLSSSNKSMF